MTHSPLYSLNNRARHLQPWKSPCLFFCLHSRAWTTDPVSQLPPSCPAWDSAVVAKAAWHCLRSVNSLLTDQLVKWGPLLPGAAEQLGSGRFCTPAWSPALRDAHPLAGYQLLPGFSRTQQPSLNLASCLSRRQGRRKNSPVLKAGTPRAKLLTEFRKSIF